MKTRDLALRLIRAVADFEKSEKEMRDMKLPGPLDTKMKMSKKKELHEQYRYWLNKRADSRNEMYRLARELWKRL